MSSELNVNDLHATDRLPEYARGELSAHDGAAVEAHLAACEACREELELLVALHAAPAQRLETEEAERLYTPLASHRGGSWTAGVWRAAAGVVLVMTGYGIWLAGRSGPQAEASWSAEAALAGWDEDLAELRPGVLDLRVALGGNGGLPTWPEFDAEGMEGLEESWRDIE